jgi:hypothetical protein
MLFPYTYVPHQMEKMHAFIDFIFYEVWCQAPIGLTFHPNLFDGNPELKEIMIDFGFAARPAKRGNEFYKDVKAIYGHFSSLSPQEVDQLKQWYKGNNDLEKVCANDPATRLARYEDIAINHASLAGQLGKFFKELYSQSLLSLKALRKKIGDIDDHYKRFVQTNKAGRCPFCGISELLGPNHGPREAYDHYLPKALYPFNSMNFRNLIPACHHCNSSYKTTKDPAHNAAGRRKAFYPFATAAQAIDIQVALQHSDIENLKPADVRMLFGPAAVTEEIETWKDVYDIEERYKARCCGDSKYWLERVIVEGQAYGKQPADILAMCVQQAKSWPFADCNFLRKPFLEACQQIGVL